MNDKIDPEKDKNQKQEDKSKASVEKKDLKADQKAQVKPDITNQSNDLKNQTNHQDINKPITKTNKGHSLVVSLAFIVGLAGCAIAAYSLYMQHQQVKSFNTTIAQKNTEYNQLKSETKKALVTLNEVIATQKQSSKLNQVEKDNISSLMKKTYALNQQVKAIKSDYLLPQSDLYQQMILIQVNAAGIYLNMADNYLKLYAGGDQAVSLIKAAESALVNADERAKPALALVRKAQYAVENATLFTQYGDNMTNINQLIAMLSELKLKLPGNAAKVDTVDHASTIDQSWYQSLKNNLDKMSSLVQIHKLNQTSQLLTNSSARENLVVTLKLQLEQAKWALQRRDSVAFKESITQVIDEVKTYYQIDQTQQKWLEIANSIQFGQSQNYMQAMHQAIYAVSRLEAQIIASATKNNNADQNQTDSKGA
ncbi:uroporphyrinogen-III C-methyltransferase [Thiotrichales bacterium 19X7-9]|nr:uroporphyrinogen-III C-methyltransferase [Thiotrichales bacterium 19X7-9]